MEIIRDGSKRQTRPCNVLKTKCLKRVSIDRAVKFGKSPGKKRHKDPTRDPRRAYFGVDLGYSNSSALVPSSSTAVLLLLLPFFLAASSPRPLSRALSEGLVPPVALLPLMNLMLSRCPAGASVPPAPALQLKATQPSSKLALQASACSPQQHRAAHHDHRH